MIVSETRRRQRVPQAPYNLWMGGSGGGRPEMAQAGGRDPGKLDQALERICELIG